MGEGLSRRSFLLGAAVLGGGAAISMQGCAPQATTDAEGKASEKSTEGHSWSVAPDPIPESDITETVDADIVIVGGGIAGVTCALRAAELGLKAVVVEKMSQPSGRGGGYAGYQTKGMTEAGIMNASKTDILERWIRICGNRVKPELIMLYLDRSGEVIDWAADMAAGKLTFTPMLTAYRGELYKEEQGWNLCLATEEFADKPEDMTNIVFYLWKKSEELGVSYYFDSPAVQLEKDDSDRVVAAVADTPDGYRRFVGTKGIVLATGDISGDPEMVEAYGDPLAKKAPVNLYTPAGANTGDGHKMAMWAGGHMEPTPICTMMHPNHYTKQCYFYLYVNADGKRFMNEDTYIQAKSLNILEQPGGDYAWSVFDSKWPTEVPASLKYGGGQFWDNMRRNPGSEWNQQTAQGIIDDAVKNNMGFICDTLEELADAMDVDQETFLAEVKEYNDLVAAGEDTRYHKRRELLTSISQPPYYALKFGPSLLCMPGGIEIDTKLRVLDEDNSPVAGLYAIGNCSGGRYAIDYPLIINGNSHGSAMTWGYVAAEEISKQ